MGAWQDNDGRLRQFGPQKATAQTGGDFVAYGDTREIEVSITLANLTTTANMIDTNVFFPVGSQVFIEQVVVETEVGMTVGSATAFSVGLGSVATPPASYVTIAGNQYPAITTVDDTAFVNGALNATVTTAGQKSTLTVGSTGVGTKVGVATSSTTVKNYLTAKSVGGTYTAGVIKVRIFYRGLTPITQ